MTKILGCFALKYAEPKLPWEIQSMIVDYLRSTQLEYLIEKYDVDWDFGFLTSFVSSNFIKDNRPWNWQSLSIISKIQFIEENISFPWDWNLVSQNKNLTVEFIKKHMDKPWDWQEVSTNIKLTTLDPDIPWSWSGLSLNKSLTGEMFLKHVDKDWNYDRLSLGRLDINIINLFPDKPWKWKFLSWIIESKDVDFKPGTAKKWLEGRLPKKRVYYHCFM